MPRPAHRQELYTATRLLEERVGVPPCLNCEARVGHETWCPVLIVKARERRLAALGRCPSCGSDDVNRTDSAWYMRTGRSCADAFHDEADDG